MQNYLRLQKMVERLVRMGYKRDRAIKSVAHTYAVSVVILEKKMSRSLK